MKYWFKTDNTISLYEGTPKEIVELVTLLAEAEAEREEDYE